VDVAKFDDAYFKPTEKKDKKKGEAEFFQVGSGCSRVLVRASCCRCSGRGARRRSWGGCSPPWLSSPSTFSAFN
jgi:hypothetical protein